VTEGQLSKKFLVAVDGSEHGWRALELAADVARTGDAELIVFHVVTHEPSLGGLSHFATVEGIAAEELSARYHIDKEIGDGITAEAVTRARAKGLERVSPRVAEGSPAREIIAEAKSEDVDMLFIGSRGLGDITGLLMGSVSHKVMHLAPCTCVTVK
jgi:nucleotide-binding universal stress UspA family protein